MKALTATAALPITNVFGQRLTRISTRGTYSFDAGLVDRCIYFERERRATKDAKGVLTT